MSRFLVCGIVLMLLLPALQTFAQTNEPDYEEVSVFLRIEKIGGIDMTGIFSFETNQFYLPATDLFSVLRINQETHTGFDSITGFFIDEENRYVIDYPNRLIRLKEAIFNFQQSDMLKTETGLYLAIDVYGKAFGLYCTFNFRAMSVELKTDIELPAIRELRLQQMRTNVERLRGEIKVDTTIDRSYNLFKFGMFDWAINSSQVTGKTTDTRIITGIGSELLWGETNFLLNFSTRDGLNPRNQQYYWRWADNESNLFKQVRLGKISTGAISSVYAPVIGATATSAPTKYRRSFGAYTLTDYTEPGWSVELYINNVIVDYTIADASGFFTFDIPLVYGTSDVTLKFYGPYGEERIREQTINIPFNFLPTGEVEYTVSAGMVQDSANSIISRADVSYGINRFVTLGGGLEYFSILPRNQELIPSLKASVTPHPYILLSGEYNHGVVSKGKFSFRNRSNMLLEVDYANYVEDQQAILFNYLEERRIALAIPLRFADARGFTRMSLKQNVYEELIYNTAELTLSSFYGPVNTNITGFANWVSGSTPFVSANIAAGIRLGRGFNLRSQAQVDVNYFEIISYRVEAERRISSQGYLSVNFEQNFRASSNSIDVSFRYDLPFAQTNISTRYGNRVLTTNQGARGSLAFGSGNNYIHTDNRSALGRGGLTFIPFLDVNHNGTRDEDEKLVDGLNVRVNGGRMLTRVNDTLTRVIELEPYTSYLVELDNIGFENIAWQVRHKAMSVYVDPNQFKIIEIPVLPMGEINGMVYIRRDGATRGIGRVLVNIYTEDGVLVHKVLTESDGYFTLLGLSPGNYYAMPDPGQQSRISVGSNPKTIDFEVLPSEWGDIIEGLDFVLTPANSDKAEIPDSATDPEKPVEEKPETPVETTQQLIAEPDAPVSNQTEIQETAPAIADEVETGPAITTPSRELDINAGRYFVQAGAFPNQAMALERKNQIDALFSYNTGIIVENNLYKLRLGYFAKKADAEDCYKVLISNGFEAFFGIAERN